MERLEKAALWAEEGKPLVDIRPAEQFNRLHIKGSTSIPYAIFMDKGILSFLPLSEITKI